jgi:hypothetical protein
MSTWKKSDPKHKAFKCSFAWHYRKSGLYLAVYYLLGGLTNGGQTSFFSSKKKVADYFDADYETVRRIFKQLVKEGWLKPAGNNGNKFWFVSHDDWAEEHPGRCCQRATLTWDNETDPLVGKLYAICDGKLRLYEGHVAGIKKLAGDEEILERFSKEVQAAKAKRAQKQFHGTSPLECYWRVYHFLKNRRATTRELPNETDATLG